MAFHQPPNRYGALGTKASATPSPGTQLTGPAVTLSMLTANMIVEHAVIKAPLILDPSGSPVKPSELHARASGNSNIFTIDIPDPHHPATAAAVGAAIRQQEARKTQSSKPAHLDVPEDTDRLHLVSPNVSMDKMPHVMSGFVYNPTTRQVTTIYADNLGAEGRALAEANRLHLHVSGAEVKPVPSEYKDFVRSPEVQTAIGKFQHSHTHHHAGDNKRNHDRTSLKIPPTGPPQASAHSFATAEKAPTKHAPPPRMA